MKQLIFLLLFLPFTLFSQTTEATKIPKVKRVTKIETGYMFGGILNLNYLAFNGAYSIAGGHGVLLYNDRFQIMPMIGVDRFNDGILFPFYLDINAYLTKGKKGFLDMKFGYSIGTNKIAAVNIDYRYKGGAVFSMGYGANLYKNENMRLTVGFNYNLRNAGINYVPYENAPKVKTSFSYHLVSGKVAVHF